MGDALLFGGGGGATGIRTKNISKAAYDNLPEEKKNDPKVVWIIEDADAYDYGASYADKLTKQMNDLIDRVNELSEALGGVKFSITESGGLRVTYEVDEDEPSVTSGTIRNSSGETPKLYSEESVEKE